MKGLKSRKIETNILTDNPYSSISQPMTARTSRDLKIIRFTGDMKENTNTLLEGIHCSCGLKRDYSQIIHAYGDKISKLREERNKFKEMHGHEKCKNDQIHEVNKKLVEEIAKLESQIHEAKTNCPSQYPEESAILEDRNELRSRIKQLQEQKLIIYQEYRELECNFNELNLQLIEAQNALKENLSRIKKDDKEGDVSDLLGDSIQDLFDDKTEVKLCLKQNQLLKSKLSRFQQILQLYDCSLQQVKQILNNHFNNMPRFETQEERNLYQMATQMNADLWRKKVEMDVRSLTERKVQLRRMEESVSKKQGKGKV